MAENTSEAPTDTSSAAQTEVERRLESVLKHYPPVLNTAQVSELLDLNPRTVLNMAQDGRLPASRLPGARKFNFFTEDIVKTLVDASMDSQTEDPAN